MSVISELRLTEDVLLDLLLAIEGSRSEMIYEILKKYKERLEKAKASTDKAISGRRSR